MPGSVPPRNRCGSIQPAMADRSRKTASGSSYRTMVNPPQKWFWRWTAITGSWLCCFVATTGIGYCQTLPRSTARTEPGDRSKDALVDAYLKRLGVPRLEIAFLEELLGESDSKKKLELAKRLADLYVGQLVEAPASTDEHVEWRRRLHELLDNVPAAHTTSVELILLEAEYQRAEALIVRWLTQPSQGAALSEARNVLASVSAALQEKRTSLEQAARRALSRWEASPVGDERAEQEALEAQTIAARASYFTAWALLYRALLEQPQNRSELQRATALFSELVGIDADRDVKEIPADSLGLESPWRARAVCGWMLGQAAGGDVAAAEVAWRWISQAATAPVQDQADYWFMYSLMWAQRWSELVQFAERRTVAPVSRATEGHTIFLVGLVHAAHFPMAPPPGDIQRRLVSLSFGALARLQQWAAIQQLANTYGLELPAESGFPLIWSQAKQKRTHADQSRRVEDYQAAIEAYRRALAKATPADDAHAVAQCKQELAWCLYRTDKYREAAQLYFEAAQALRRYGDNQAVQAAWMAAVCIEKGFFLPDATEVLRPVVDWLQKEFPGHESTHRAAFLLDRLSSQSLPLDQQIEQLENTPATHPNFVAACQEAIRLRFVQWQKSEGPEKVELGIAFLEKATALLPVIEARLTSDQRFALRTMLLKVAIESKQWPQAEQCLREVEKSWAEWNSDQRSEFRYLGVQVARHQRHWSRIVELADWFLGEGRASRYELAGLAAAANALEQAAELNYRTLLVQIYTRLIDRWGSDPSHWATDRNAHAAAAKLAALSWELGQKQEALRLYETLLKAFPKERAYLRAVGLLSFEQGDWNRSLPCWRTVLAGTPDGTDAWYEAKYYQLRCLLETDRRAARQVWEEFQILVPPNTNNKWYAQLQQIGRALSER